MKEQYNTEVQERTTLAPIERQILWVEWMDFYRMECGEMFTE